MKISFDPNLPSSQNAATTTSGCLSTILRRFLCTGSFRTHPSFHCIKETTPVEFDCSPKQADDIDEKKQGSVTPPGIIARLMGLDSMPSTRTPDSIGRCRSANSVDYWSDFDPTQRQHRRVKSSLSFREMPTSLHQENDEFLVLTFQDISNENDLKSKDRQRNRDNRAEKKKQDQHGNKRSGDSNNMNKLDRRIGDKDKSSKSARNKEENTRSSVSSKVRRQSKDGSRVEKDMKRRQEEKKAETTCSPENSSPVSVLDLAEFASDPETLLSEEESKLTSSKPRRKLSTHLEHSELPCPNSTSSLITRLSEPDSINCHNKETAKTDDLHNGDGMELWGEEAWRLTVEEMNMSKWMPREISKTEESEEIRIELGLQILDQILQEIVVELAGIGM